jgi:isopenicillin-N epimerase
VSAAGSVGPDGGVSHAGSVSHVVERDGWLLDPDVAQVNHGGFGALPRAIAGAAATMREEVERDPTAFLRRWDDRVGEVRGRAAQFLHADEAGLVFVPNATTGTATVLSSWRFSPGDEVVVTDHGYDSVCRQLDALVASAGVRPVTAAIPLDLDSTSDVVAAVMSAVGPATRLVVIDHIASATGMLFPVAELVAAAHDAGVAVLVDGAHAPGQVEVDLAAIGADFWVGNWHKWVCSPRASAVLSVAPQWRASLRPLVASHGYADGFAAAFDWTGTLDPVPLLTLPSALDYWAARGWEQTRRLQRSLVAEGAAVVARALGSSVAGRAERAAAMRVIELPHALGAGDARRLADRLTERHRVTTAITTHAGRTFVRVCGQVYNVVSDYERLAAALVVELDALVALDGR